MQTFMQDNLVVRLKVLVGNSRVHKRKNLKLEKKINEQLGYKLTGKTDVNESVNERSNPSEVNGDFELLLRDFEKL